MDRREMLGALGATTLGLSALSGLQSAHAAEPHAHKLDSTHKDCLEACGDCAEACDTAFHHCLTMVAQGKAEHAKPLEYFASCAGFCALSACNIAKMSPLMAHSCEACADACKDTLAVVAKFDSPEMKAATKELERCIKSCREMVAKMGHDGHHN